MRLIYMADPMCSQRYGFGPQLVDLRKRLADAPGIPVPVTVITDDLRPGQRELMVTDKRDEILRHWHAVTERSSMPLDQSFTVATCRDGFVYDIEPVCRAVIVAREHWAEDNERVLTLFHAVQHTLYGKGRDTTQVGVLRNVAFANDVEVEHFGTVFDTDVLRDEMRKDFRLSRRWDITSFLGLLTEQGGALYQTGRGCAPSVMLYVRVVEVLQRHPVPDAG